MHCSFPIDSIWLTYGSFLLASERNGQIISVRHQVTFIYLYPTAVTFVSLDAPL